MTVSTDYEENNFCEAAHRITVSLDGNIKPLTITLPCPILPGTVKTTQDFGIIRIVADKALDNLWPDDAHRRWDAEHFEPWIDLETLKFHLNSQFDDPAKLDDAATQVREIIRRIFIHATEKGHLRIQLKEKEADSPDWFIRAHAPVRISPLGTPILLLSALDHRLSERLQSDEKLDKSRAKKEFHRFFGHVPPEEKVLIVLETAEIARLLRHILRLNSTKIRPPSWHKENVIQDKSSEQPVSPWLSTFIRPLYRDQLTKGSSDFVPSSSACLKCNLAADNLKLCGRCKAASYCSIDCQRADWSSHKLSCSKV